MHPQQWALVGINLVGGSLVLASYVHGILTHPANRRAIWGGVPETIKPLYTVSMLLAAAGYLAFTYLVLFQLDPEKVQILNHFDFRVFLFLYPLILIPSALWMPFTFAMLEHPSKNLWWAIRIVLAIVGLASLALLTALLGLDPREPQAAYWVAVAGSIAFCLQTALLDALVWPVFFPFRS